MASSVAIDNLTPSSSIIDTFDVGNPTVPSSTLSSSPVGKHSSSVLVDSNTVMPAYTGEPPPSHHTSSNATINSNAVACNRARLSWTSAESQYSATASGVITVNMTTSTIITTSFSTLYPNVTGGVYTLCDKMPRVNSTPVVQTQTIHNTTTSTGTFTLYSPFTQATPSCIIKPTDCVSLWNSFYAAVGAYNVTEPEPQCTNTIVTTPATSSGNSSVSGASFETDLPSAFGASRTTATLDAYFVPDAPCTITGGPVQLLYWPVQTVGGNMCGGNRSTITATPTINGSVKTISSMGMVFSSPSVYISFETLYAVDTAGSTVGAPMSSFILPQPANAVSTQCGTYRFGPGSGHGTAMNYADLNYPVPWSAYSCMSKCRPSGLGCKTIWDDFVPILAFPTGIQTLNPAWGSCGFGLDGCRLVDPPIALQTQDSLVSTPPPEPPAPQSGDSLTAASPPSPTPTPASPSSSLQPPAANTGTSAPMSPVSLQGPPSSSSTGVIISPGFVATAHIESSQTLLESVGSVPGKQLNAHLESSQTSVQAPLVPTTSNSPSHNADQVASAQAAQGLANPASTKTSPEAVDSQVAAASSHAAGLVASLLGNPTRSAAGPAQNDATTAVNQAAPLGAAQPASSMNAEASRSPDPSTPSQNSPTSSPSQAPAGALGSNSAIAKADPASPTTGAPQAAAAPVTVGTYRVSAAPSGLGGVIIGGQTLQPGAKTTVDNTPISVAKGGIVVGGNGNGGGSTVPIAALPQGHATPAATVGGQGVTPDPSSPGGVVIGGQTLQPGETTIINNTPVSVASGAIVVGGSSTIPVAATTTTAATPLATVGGLVISVDPANPGGVVVNGQTLKTGTQINIGTTPVVVGIGSLVVGSSVIAIPTAGGSNNFPNAVVSAAQAGTTASQAVFTVGSQTFTARASQSGLIVGSVTIIAGGAAATAGNGQVVSLGPQDVVVGSSTIVFSAAAPTPAAVLTIGSQPYTVNAGGSVVIGSTTLSMDGPAVTVSGQVVSLASQGVVVGGSTIAFSAQPTASGAVVTIGGQTYTAINSAGSFVLGSTNLAAGQVATLSGVVVSAGPSGIVIGGSTVPVSALSPAAAAAATSGAVITLGGQTYTAAASAGSFVVGPSTLTAGQVATIAGTVVSAGPSGLVVGSSTVPVSALHPAITSGAVFTVGGQTYTAVDPSGDVVIGSTTLTPGQVATISGTVLSVASGGLVVGSSTLPFSAFAAGSTAGTAAQVEAIVTLGSQTHTATKESGVSGVVMIGGSMLSIGGPAATIDGQIVSEGASGLVVGGSSTALFSTAAASATSSAGAGASVTATFGTGTVSAGAAGTSAGTTQKAAAARGTAPWSGSLRGGLALVLGFLAFSG